MVCAICGRMPLMMQSAPIRRAAATVFSRCCATSVSTVGTPVMSMIAISAPVSTIALQQALHHHLRAVAVERADERQGEDVLPQLRPPGVDSSSSSCCWRTITSSRPFW